MTIIFIIELKLNIMKTKTFNLVFSMLAILFLMYSIVCAVLAMHDEPDGVMPWYIVIWIVYGIGVIVWSLYYGNKAEDKQVYYLNETDHDNWLRSDADYYTGPEPVNTLEMSIADAQLKAFEKRFGTSCTCTSCSQALKCKFAFDAYNIDGDCLAEK